MPRRDYSKVAFAATGDTNVIPSTTQPDGSVSLPQGWGFDYQRDNGAGGGTPDPLAKNIDREDMNGILNEITASIGEIQQNGSPIWVSTAAPYPINARVRHLDKNWQSAVANNSAVPGADSSWTDSALITGRLLSVQRFTASGTYTPTPGTKFNRYKIQAGGGAGGGAQGTTAGQQSVGGGGGGGGYSEGIALNPVSSAVVVGIGGAPGAAGLSPGGAGGTSSYIGVTATGGAGGSPGPGLSSFPGITAGGVAGVGSGATLLNTRAVAGGIGLNAASANVASGNGGASVFGGGGQAVGGTGFGSASSTVGAGGSGGVCFASVPGGAAGGAGGSGIVIIEDYS